jgi:hypothetical protein
VLHAQVSFDDDKLLENVQALIKHMLEIGRAHV